MFQKNEKVVSVAEYDNSCQWFVDEFSLPLSLSLEVDGYSNMMSLF